MTDDLDDLLDDGDEGDDTTEDSDSEESESEGAKDPKSTDKRIRDLQSARDKETARANKAEKQLKALMAVERGAEGGKPPNGGDAANDGMLDMARMFVYQQHPKLAEYGISQSDLSGSTPGEVAQSAAELVARFEGVETKVRNKLLADQGLAPEIDGGAPPQAPRDFSKMPKEDFDKLVDAAMKGSH